MRTPVVVALAVVAVLVVLGVGVLALVTGVGGDEAERADTGSDSGAPTEGEESTDEAPGDDASEGLNFFPGGQVLTGDRRDNANVEVPSPDDGWETTVSDYTISYLDAEGLPAVGVTGPAVWRSGPCGDEEDDARAWAGFTAPTTDEGGDDVAAGSVELVSGLWRDALDEDPDLTVGEVETSTATVSDGSEAATARLTFTTAEDGPDCYPPAYELRFLSIDTGDFVANLVLQRGVRRDGSDAPGHLDAETADVILTSARKQQAG